MNEDAFRAACLKLEQEGYVRVKRTDEIPCFAYNVPDWENHPEVVYALLKKEGP